MLVDKSILVLCEIKYCLLSSSVDITSSIIVDLSKTYQPKYSYVHHNDPIIEEISIRDITSLNNGGTFADLINTLNTNTGLGYLKEIGFNYLQLMPVFGFGGVDEIHHLLRLIFF